MRGPGRRQDQAGCEQQQGPVDGADRPTVQIGGSVEKAWLHARLRRLSRLPRGHRWRANAPRLSAGTVPSSGSTPDMSDSDKAQSPLTTPPAPKLPTIESPPPEGVLEDVPSKDDVIKGVPAPDEVVERQPGVDEILGRDR